jgi:DNA replication regulator DPB11
MSGFLKQARELSRANSISGGENGEQPPRRRRPLLGRTSSLSSARNTAPKRGSRASSIDTLNEDGYGSAVDSVDTDSNNIQNAIKYPAALRGQSFTSVLSGGGAKFTGYVDSPAYHDENLLREDDAPAMTQLNYEDPDAMAMREEFLRRAHGHHTGKDQEESISTHDNNSKRPTVVNELPTLAEELGNRTAGRRTRRSANKSKEADNNIF